MAKDYTIFDTKGAVNNISGNNFTINMQIIYDPYMICINNNITSILIAQILNNASSDLTTIASYSTTFLNPFTAQYLQLKGKLFTDTSLTIQDFFDYYNGKIPLTAVNGDQYYKIVSNPIYSTELSQFNLLIQNLLTFYNLIVAADKLFYKYFNLLNVYNNFFSLFSNVFFSTNYSSFSPVYQVFITDIRQILSVSSQLYLDTNDANYIRLTNDYFVITKIAFGTYNILLNNISLPNSTNILMYNNLQNIEKYVINDSNANKLFTDQEILSNYQDKIIVNSNDTYNVDYIILPEDKTLSYSFLRNANNGSLSLISQNSNQLDNDIIIPDNQSIVMSEMMARVVLAGQPPELSNNFNYYNNSSISVDVPKYTVGALRLDNLELDTLYPGYYIRVKNQTVNIIDYQNLFNRCLADIRSYSVINNNEITGWIVNNSLYNINQFYTHRFVIGSKFLFNNSLVTVTGVNNNILTLDTNITPGSVLSFLEHPCLNYSTPTTMLIKCQIQDSLPLGGLSNKEIFPDSSQNSIMLQPTNIPSMQFFGYTNSYYGKPSLNNNQADLDLNSGSGTIVNNILATGNLSGDIGNANPSSLDIRQSTAFLYKIFIKFA